MRSLVTSGYRLMSKAYGASPTPRYKKAGIFAALYKLLCQVYPCYHGPRALPNATSLRPFGITKALSGLPMRSKLLGERVTERVIADNICKVLDVKDVTRSGGTDRATILPQNSEGMRKRGLLDVDVTYASNTLSPFVPDPDKQALLLDMSLRPQRRLRGKQPFG